MPERTFWKTIRPAILWAVIILFICGVPGNKIPELTFLQWLKPDKIVHLLLFGLQCYLLLKAFKVQADYEYLSHHSKISALLITIAYGGLVEILQELVFINRNGDLRDFIANTIGAFLGLWIYRRWEKKNLGKNL